MPFDPTDPKYASPLANAMQDRMTGMMNQPQTKVFAAQPQDNGMTTGSPIMPGQTQLNQIMGMAKGGLAQQPDELSGIKNQIRGEFAARGLDFDRFVSNPAVMDEVGKSIQSHGRNGDTILAHINPQEAALLKEMGGSGDINVHTGLPQFDNPSMGDYGGSWGGSSASNYTGGSNLGGYGGSGSGSASWSGGGNSFSSSGGGRDSSSSNQSPSWSGGGGSGSLGPRGPITSSNQSSGFTPSTGGGGSIGPRGPITSSGQTSGFTPSLGGGGGSSQNTISPAGPSAPSINLGGGEASSLPPSRSGMPSFSGVNATTGMPESPGNISNVAVPAAIAGGLGAFAPNSSGVQAYAPLSDLEISTGNSPLSSPDTASYDLDAINLQRQAKQNAEIAEARDIFDAQQRLQGIQNTALNQAQSVAMPVEQTGLTGFEAALGTVPTAGPSMSSQIGSLFNPSVSAPTTFGSGIPQAGAFVAPPQAIDALASNIPGMQMEAAMSIMGGGSGFDLAGISGFGSEPAISSQPVAAGPQSLEDIMGTTPQGNYLYSGITPGAVIGPEQYSLDVAKAYEDWGAKNPGLKAALELPFAGGMETFNSKIPNMLAEKPIGSAVSYDPTSRTFTVTDPNSSAIAELKTPGASDLSSYLTDITKYGPSTTNWGAPAPVPSQSVSFDAGPASFADLTPLGPETPAEPMGSIPMFAQNIGAPAMSIDPVNMGNVPAYSSQLAEASFPNAQQIADIQQAYAQTPGFNDTMIAAPQQPGILNAIGNFLMPSAQAATPQQTTLDLEDFQTAQQTPAANLFTGDIPLPPTRPEEVVAAIASAPAPVKAAIKAQAGTSTNPPANTQQPQTAYDQQVAALEDAGMIANGMSKEEYADFIGVPVSEVKTRVTGAFGPPMAEYYTKSLFEAFAGMTGGKDNLTGAANMVSMLTPMGILGLIGRSAYNKLTSGSERNQTETQSKRPSRRRPLPMAEGGMVEGTEDMMMASPLMMAATNNAAPQIQYLARPVAYSPLNFATPQLNIPRSQFAAPVLPPIPPVPQPNPNNPTTPTTPTTPPVVPPNNPTTPTRPPRQPRPPKPPQGSDKKPRGVLGFAPESTTAPAATAPAATAPAATSPFSQDISTLDFFKLPLDQIQQMKLRQVFNSHPGLQEAFGNFDRYKASFDTPLMGAFADNMYSSGEYDQLRPYVDGFASSRLPSSSTAPLIPDPAQQSGPLSSLVQIFGGAINRLRPGEKASARLENAYNSSPQLQQSFGSFDRFYRTYYAPLGGAQVANHLMNTGQQDKLNSYIDDWVMNNQFMPGAR